MIPYDDKLYIISGKGRSFFSDLYEFQPDSKTWRKIQVNYYPRYGFSACLYNNKILLCGGGSEYDKVMNIRQC